MERPPLLRATELCRQLDNRSLLDNINLTVRDGDVTVVMGPSGAGKTTLLKCLNLLTLPSSGELAFDEEVVFRARPLRRGRLGRVLRQLVTGSNSTSTHSLLVDLATYRQRFGVVFQEFNLWPHMTLFDNISAPLRWIGRRSTADVRAAVEEQARVVGIERLLNRYPSEVSGGERQRAAIARALITKPRVLLLDEITSALDPERVVEMLALIEQLKTSGHTMVIVTHYVRFAQRIATTAVLLVGGRLVEFGPNPAFFTAPQTPELANFLNKFAEL